MHHQKTIVGGTFDQLHKGHRALLEKAFETGKVVVGLTSDKMAEERKGRKVEEYEKRETALYSLAKEKGHEIDVRKINDSYGFALEEDFQNIIVSRETYKTALEINEKRIKDGKNPLNVTEVSLILADDGNPISSTRIYRKEIDREGKLI